MAKLSFPLKVEFRAFNQAALFRNHSLILKSMDCQGRNKTSHEGVKVMAMAQGTADTVTDKKHSLVSPWPLMHFLLHLCYATLKHTSIALHLPQSCNFLH